MFYLPENTDTKLSGQFSFKPEELIYIYKTSSNIIYKNHNDKYKDTSLTVSNFPMISFFRVTSNGGNTTSATIIDNKLKFTIYKGTDTIINNNTYIGLMVQDTRDEEKCFYQEVDITYLFTKGHLTPKPDNHIKIGNNDLPYYSLQFTKQYTIDLNNPDVMKAFKIFNMPPENWNILKLKLVFIDILKEYNKQKYNGVGISDSDCNPISNDLYLTTTTTNNNTTIKYENENESQSVTFNDGCWEYTESSNSSNNFTNNSDKEYWDQVLKNNYNWTPLIMPLMWKESEQCSDPGPGPGPGPGMNTITITYELEPFEIKTVNIK